MRLVGMLCMYVLCIEREKGERGERRGGGEIAHLSERDCVFVYLSIA